MSIPRQIGTRSEMSFLPQSSVLRSRWGVLSGSSFLSCPGVLRPGSQALCWQQARSGAGRSGVQGSRAPCSSGQPSPPGTARPGPVSTWLALLAQSPAEAQLLAGILGCFPAKHILDRTQLCDMGLLVSHGCQSFFGVCFGLHVFSPRGSCVPCCRSLWGQKRRLLLSPPWG